MSFRLFPKPAFISSEGDEAPTRSYHYGAIGASDETTVRLAAMSAAPLFIATLFGVLFRGNIRINQAAWKSWDVDIEYIRRPNQIGSYTFDFDTTGGTEHVTNSLETVEKYPSGTAPDYKGAIDVVNHEVRGTERVVPTSRLNVTFAHPVGVITMNYCKYLEDLTGYYNSAPMFGRAAGQMLFLGARASDGSQVEASCTYSFAIRRNWSGVSIGDITGIDKLGWDHHWIKYQEVTTTVGSDSYTVQRPKFVYVERIYDSIDLKTALGFG